MAEDTSLSAYLDGQRKNGAACFCETAPKEIVKQVDAVILGGSRQWTAMCRWLGEQGIATTKTKIADHWSNGHGRA